MGDHHLICRVQQITCALRCDRLALPKAFKNRIYSELGGDITTAMASRTVREYAANVSTVVNEAAGIFVAFAPAYFGEHRN
jgi:hypothetical protein